VRGFRGFAGEQTFGFSTPATILAGGNHCGKSSTLNALEWCLFGDECTGKDTNIRERIGWVIHNHHMERPDVCVELRLTGSDGEFIVRRQLRQQPRKRTLLEELEVECSDGEAVDGAAAEHLLGRLLRTSFRDFSTMVYQHQELIRGIVTQEPTYRNDSIDRLLGLADYRNCLSGIADAKPKGYQKDADNKFDAFEKQVGTAFAMVQLQLEGGRREAEAAGIPRTRLTEKTLLDLVCQVAGEVQGFATGIGLELPAVDPPMRWQEVSAVENSLRDRIQELRGSLRDQEEQSTLYRRQTAVNNRITDYRDLKKREGEIGGAVRQLDTTWGSHQRVIARKGEIEQRLNELGSEREQISGRHLVLVDALAYLEACDASHVNRCPVCETEVHDLLPAVRGKVEQALQGKLDEVNTAIAGLENELEGLKEPTGKYQQFNDALAGSLAAKQELAQAVAQLLERDLSDDDDPVGLLRAEGTRVAQRLEQLKRLIDSRQERLTQLDSQLGKVRVVREVLHQAERQQIIERIKQTEQFSQLNWERDRFALFLSDVEAIQRAISEAAHEEADQKLQTARIAIDGYFRRLTGNPAVKRIVLDLKEDTKSGRNVYSVTDQDGRDLTPILSQGDLNALALAIFLGLATAGAPAAALGFVMLDDPSQSMGAEHKSNLAGVLDEVCRTKQVLLATMDDEFCTYLDKGLTKAKTVYLFEDWTPSAGPSVHRR
jgi:DNA repair exonuclease SbcCD ATPase subunit